MAVGEIRDEVRRCGARRRGRRFPAELRTRLQSVSRSRWSEGQSASQIAASLGISVGTVRRWCQESASTRRALVPVAVIEEAEAPVALRLISPSGWRVEGLDLASAVALLQRLR